MPRPYDIYPHPNPPPQGGREQELVSVLIVNYNGRRHLDDCLAALERQTVPRDRFEVVVVDNASSDDSREVIPVRYPWVRFVPLDRNVGFAEGNNVAHRHARVEDGQVLEWNPR